MGVHLSETDKRGTLEKNFYTVIIVITALLLFGWVLYLLSKSSYETYTKQTKATISAEYFTCKGKIFVFSEIDSLELRTNVGGRNYLEIIYKGRFTSFTCVNAEDVFQAYVDWLINRKVTEKGG
jgi:hypothetical protein